eukprot:347290-Chlamydomonas_euryale.AAC.2
MAPARVYGIAAWPGRRRTLNVLSHSASSASVAAIGASALRRVATRKRYCCWPKHLSIAEGSGRRQGQGRLNGGGSASVADHSCGDGHSDFDRALW